MTPADGAEKQDDTESRDHAPSIGSVTSGQSHTPGPWELYEDGGALEIRSALDGDVDSDTGRHFVIGGDLIAAVFDGKHDKANARLIAAAPSLLEALRAVVDASPALIVKAVRTPDDGFGLESWTAAINAARAALSLATGASNAR